jgi:hypothetical protein
MEMGKTSKRGGYVNFVIGFKQKTNSVALVRERTITTESPQLVGGS